MVNILIDIIEVVNILINMLNILDVCEKDPIKINKWKFQANISKH